MDYRIVKDQVGWAIAPVRSILPAVNKDYQVTIITDTPVTPHFNTVEDLCLHVKALGLAFTQQYCEIVRYLEAEL